MPPRLFSHYTIVSRLGGGGMGEVYLARDERGERMVALKVMSQALARDPQQLNRFRTEASAARALSHPGICAIYEVGELDGRPFIAMEYVPGRTLDAAAAERRFTVREALRIALEAAEALDAAHSRGFLHRDIKPSNLMLRADGTVAVMDFGLAKWYAPEQFGSGPNTAARTRTGMVIGTPQYMSPEQVSGAALGPASDCFSLGVVLYELLAGRRPFAGVTAEEATSRILHEPPRPLRELAPWVSPDLERVLSLCLEKDPGLRYTSAGELAADLKALLRKEPADPTILTPPAAPGPAASPPAAPTALWKLAHRAHRGGSWGWAAVLLAAVVLAFLFVLWLTRTSGAP